MSHLIAILVDMMNADDRLAALAATQHQVVSRQQAFDAVGRGGLSRRVVGGRLCRLGDGAFHFRGAIPDWRGVLQAALFDAGNDAAVSLGSGGRLHRFPSYSNARPEIIVPYALDHRCEIAVVHESRRFDRIPLTEVDGLPVTTPEATLFLLAAGMRVGRLAWLTDELVAAKRISIPELERVRGVLGGRGVPGSSAVKAVIADRAPGAPVPESRLERTFLKLCDDFGVPKPRWQVPMPGWADLPGRVDGCYMDRRVIVEVDGRRWHTRVADFERDHRRDLHAASLGYRVARITALMMKVEPWYVAERLRAALRANVA